MKNKFTIPKLNKSSKYWYVHYRYEGVQFRETYGLNKIEDLSLREFEYDKVCKSLLVQLSKGWNPNITDNINMSTDMYFVEALKFALAQKKSDIGKATYCSYNGTIKFLEIASVNIKIDKLKIIDLKRMHVRMLMDEAKRNRSWTNKAYNTHLLHLKILLYALIKYDVLESNPASRIDNKKVDKESDFNKPATEKDIEIIKKTLIEKDYRFYVFSITVFHTGIRMTALLQVKVGMVDLNKNEFRLPGKITKNGKSITVPINKHLKEFLLNMEIDKMPKDYYLFGSLKSQGKGRKAKENKLLPDFLPSKFPTIRRTASMRWKKIVKEELGIKMNLYAMKHYGADKKILAGMSMDSLRELYGHSSYLMTEKYAKIIKEVYRKDIMENSPEF